MHNKEKTTARIVAALFILALIASIWGGTLIDSVLSAPDFQLQLAENANVVIFGVLLELVNGIAVIGIAVLMFPFLKRYDEGLALGYVALRIVETVIVIAAVISPLALIVLSQEYVTAGAEGSANFASVSRSFIAVRTYLVGQLTGIFFCLAALLFFYLLYQTELVPRFISIWGLIGVALVLTWNLLELFGIHVRAGMVLALPMILNEFFLAIWLIVKGFNSSIGTAEPVIAAVNQG